MEQNRIIGDIINIEQNSVKNFYNKRIKNISNISAINLQSDLKLSQNRDSIEKDVFLLNIDLKKFNRILDIGCGIGRVINYIKDFDVVYNGLDISEEAIKKASEEYKNYKNFHFQNINITNLEKKDLAIKDSFSLIISMGTLMYVNDNKLNNLFHIFNELLAKNSMIYIRESISIMKDRLTLKNFYSEELKSNYSAIYRTKEEYEELFDRYFIKNNFKLQKSDILLKGNLANRKETNQMYWIFKRG
ncbi:MAG TPA: class I SAM-dependent methyltransferase [Rickettsiales bacterium]|nr:class I SAM-dependent methyltransferase [Rickettsiales bacterium]